MDPFDCEVLRAVIPRQPVNTVSSVAFLVAAVVVWRRGHRIPALAVAVAGVGSVLFHGVPSVPSSRIHDVGLALTLAVAALQVWRRATHRQPPWAAGLVFATGGLVWLSSRTGGALCQPTSALQGHALWHVLAAVSFVLLYPSPDVAVPGRNGEEQPTGS